jgi:hypothetical protein
MIEAGGSVLTSVPEMRGQTAVEWMSQRMKKMLLLRVAGWEVCSVTVSAAHLLVPRDVSSGLKPWRSSRV